MARSKTATGTTTTATTTTTTTTTHEQPKRNKKKSDSTSSSDHQSTPKKQKRSSPTPWSKEDDKLLRQYAEDRKLSWRKIAEHVFKGKFTSGQCHQHWHRVLSNSINKDEWTCEEELKMVQFIARQGTHSWSVLSKYMGNGRIDIQCRQKWKMLTKSFPKLCLLENGGYKITVRVESQEDTTLTTNNNNTPQQLPLPAIDVVMKAVCEKLTESGATMAPSPKKAKKSSSSPAQNAKKRRKKSSSDDDDEDEEDDVEYFDKFDDGKLTEIRVAIPSSTCSVASQAKSSSSRKSPARTTTRKVSSSNNSNNNNNTSTNSKRSSAAAKPRSTRKKMEDELPEEESEAEMSEEEEEEEYHSEEEEEDCEDEEQPIVQRKRYPERASRKRLRFSLEEILKDDEEDEEDEDRGLNNEVGQTTTVANDDLVHPSAKKPRLSIQTQEPELAISQASPSNTTTCHKSDSSRSMMEEESEEEDSDSDSEDEEEEEDRNPAHLVMEDFDPSTFEHSNMVDGLDEVLRSISHTKQNKDHHHIHDIIENHVTVQDKIIPLDSHYSTNNLIAPQPHQAAPIIYVDHNVANHVTITSTYTTSVLPFSTSTAPPHHSAMDSSAGSGLFSFPHEEQPHHQEFDYLGTTSTGDSSSLFEDLWGDNTSDPHSMLLY